MASDIASSLRVWAFGGGETRALIRTPIGLQPRSETSGSGLAWRKHKGLGRELIEGALPYLHGAETRYELDEMGLRCSIALPLGMDGRQERL
jgi:hypothetical protein